MSEILDQLIEMGFSRERAEFAIKEIGGTDIQTVTEWILSHPEPETDNTDGNIEENQSQVPVAEEATPESLSEEAKSIQCTDCGKLFSTKTQVEFHSAKSGHVNYSESTEEKKPLTDEEKKEQLAKIEAKLRQRRLDREAREKQESLERERNRIKSGKDLLEAKRKQEEMEMKKIVEQRKREKQEEKLAKERVRSQIEQDKLARKAKFGAEPSASSTSAPVQPTTNKSAPNTSYTEVKLQIRLPNGSNLTHAFGAKEPLSAVRLFIELNRTDGQGPFSLLTPFPRKEFFGDDYDKPLDLLGLAPSAVLVVQNQ